MGIVMRAEATSVMNKVMPPAGGDNEELPTRGSSKRDGRRKVLAGTVSLADGRRILRPEVAAEIETASTLGSEGPPAGGSDDLTETAIPIPICLVALHTIWV